MKITVYCGSSSRLDPEYIAAAAEVGRLIARRGATLVYGAGRTGMMGAAADAALAEGGDVTGVIPSFMVQRGWNHTGLTEMIVTEGMHLRKETMMRLADSGVIALPGGIGTFEEITEAITWRQLGLYSGNVVLFNFRGYYDSFLAQIDRAIADGFMMPDHRDLFAVATTAAEAVELAARTCGPRCFSSKF